MTQARVWIAISLGLCLIGAVWMLEQVHRDLDEERFHVGETPVVLTRSDSEGPLVVVAHGFAGSSQMLGAIASTLAGAGYQVVRFDFEGHGRHGVPMRGDVTRLDGTTEYLIAQTQEVLTAARARTGWKGPAALVGHSMASDIVIRTALRAPEGEIAAVVAISMYSEAVTADAPERLLILTGAGEPHLRKEALRVLRLIDENAQEGMETRAGDVVRRAVVAPGVEHVGVLFSATTLRAVTGWLDAAFDRGPRQVDLRNPGPWLALALVACLGLVWPLSPLLGPRQMVERPGQTLGVTGRALGLSVLVPLALWPLSFVPGVIDPMGVLAVHLLVLGAGLHLIAARMGAAAGQLNPAGVALLLGLCGLLFGGLLDRYGASFAVTGLRWPVFVALVPGAMLMMISERRLMQGRGPVVALALRALIVASLVGTLLVKPEERFFLATVVLILILFFVLFSRPATWVAQRSSPATAGAALGLILAWAVAAGSPLHAG